MSPKIESSVTLRVDRNFSDNIIRKTINVYLEKNKITHGAFENTSIKGNFSENFPSSTASKTVHKKRMVINRVQKKKIMNEVKLAEIKQNS